MTVTTTHGRLRGVRGDTAISFKGIPYAADTGGDGRFQAPRPVAGWSGVRDAFTLGDQSPQSTERMPVTPVFSWEGGDPSPFSENCCVLNVYTPGLDTGARRPVMVYMHGGGYISGSGGESILDGSHLARFGDVVVVTVNHRLNAFGYTHLGAFDPAFADAGNAGQLDLVAALRWVKDNIAEFGGDSGNVTLFGQSGGGGKVMALMGMPAASGLFHRAINMSGPWSHVTAASTERYTEEILKTFGLARGDARKLQHVAADALLRARAKAVAAARFEAARPVIDGHHLPAAIMSSQGLALHADVPLLMGSVDTEATFYFRRDRRNFEVSANQMRARIRAQYGLDDTGVQGIVDAYLHDEPRATPPQILAAFASDVRFRTPMISAVEPKADAGRALVYVYNFAWKAPVDGGIWGSPHTVDIPFAFANVDKTADLTGGSPEALEVSRSLASAFVAFARSGDPNNPRMPQWKAYDSASRTSMVVDADCRAASDYHGAARVASAQLPTLDGPTLNRGPLYNYME
ncbi:carboxylesterase/lipase family protein [Rhodoferax sediminis]|uniref:Carboxylic ester hydrolase n=1 Tax=Rhodoferax sediminis TaxID=2509614 RepID=A0A515DHC8_9BURK|nr:carboxylesterase/lipase family protein [Rhodoferax sediminis]